MSTRNSDKKSSGVFTGEDDVLDIFVGVVCDVDVSVDRLTVVIKLNIDSREKHQKSTSLVS